MNLPKLLPASVERVSSAGVATKDLSHSERADIVSACHSGNAADALDA
jgi:hypothetical protein